MRAFERGPGNRDGVERFRTGVATEAAGGSPTPDRTLQRGHRSDLAADQEAWTGDCSALLHLGTWRQNGELWCVALGLDASGAISDRSWHSHGAVSYTHLRAHETPEHLV